LEIKQLECETDHTPPTRAEVKDVWGFTSNLLYIFMTWLLSAG
jgi:hypothetical protein